MVMTTDSTSSSDRMGVALIRAVTLRPSGDRRTISSARTVSPVTRVWARGNSRRETSRPSARQVDDFKPRIRELRERQDRLEHSAEEARAALAQRRKVLDDVNAIAAYAREMKDFLEESELAERRAFIETFVKEILVVPGDALMRYTIPISQSTRKAQVLVGGGFG